MTAKSMIVAGIMSGTSADGIDVAVVRITPGRSRDGVSRPSLKLLVHEGFPYHASLRRAVLAAMNAAATSTAELARLNWRLGLAYAEAAGETMKRHRLKLDLIGCHGQTLYHQSRELLPTRGAALPARGRAAKRLLLPRRLVCRWYRIFGPRTCSPEARVHRWCRCSTTCCIRRRKAGTRAAEHRRHCEPDRDSCRCLSARGTGLRYRAGQHGNRRSCPAAFEQTI